MIRVLVVTVLLGFLAAPAHAQDKTGWGVAAGVGVSQIKDTDGGDTFRGSATGFSAEFEYRFVPSFALGAGFFQLGTADDTFNSVRTEIEVSGFGIFGRLIYPVSEGVDLYGRFGGVNYSSSVRPGGLSILTDPFGDEALEFGLGADIGRKNLMLRIEGRYFDGSSDEEGVLATVGFSYRF